MNYQIEKHTNIEWVVTARQEGDNLRNVRAKCPAEGIALTIKRMYEKQERQDLEQDTSLKALCKQLAEAIQTVPYDSYSDALRDGCDAHGAWDCFRGAMKKWEASALEAAKALPAL